VERPAIGARLVRAIAVAAHQPIGTVVVTGAGGFGKTMSAWACHQVGEHGANVKRQR
jgi:type II secretory ATPase GspE/PulE/Tfp pilus assembly ATPase PilB-like protein